MCKAHQDYYKAHQDYYKMASIGADVVVFGVFDLLHPGHIYFLEAASKFGQLHVIVSRDDSVRFFKHKDPIQPEELRLEQITKLSYVHKVYLGDNSMGTYEVLKFVNPKYVCVGHDQQNLCKHLKEQLENQGFPQVEIIQIDAFHPELYSTTILRKQMDSTVVKT